VEKRREPCSAEEKRGESQVGAEGCRGGRGGASESRGALSSADSSVEVLDSRGFPRRCSPDLPRGGGARRNPARRW
jgi:hypothetical protein